MNPPLSLSFADPDPNAAPINITDLVELLKQLIFGEIAGDYIPYVLGSSTPGVDDQDKTWLKQDTQGRPVALMTFYSGNWRRVYNGMIGEIRMFQGDPGDTNTWDANGHGVIGGEYDGWQICNGQNGSPDLSDIFPVAAHMNNTNGQTGFNAGRWQSFVDQTTCQPTGGSKDHKIVASDLPPLDAVNGLSSLTLHGFSAKEASPTHTSVSPLVDVNYADLQPHDAVIANYGSSPNGTPPVAQSSIPTLPPFTAVAFIIFQGY